MLNFNYEARREKIKFDGNKISIIHHQISNLNFIKAKNTFINFRYNNSKMVQLSSAGPASSCRSWSGPLLSKAHDLTGRRNGRLNISEDKGS